MELDRIPIKDRELPAQPQPKSEQQIAHELFTQNLEKKIIVLNQTRLKNPPKNTAEEAALLKTSDLSKEELIHLLAITTGRLNAIANNLQQILQSI